MAATTIHRSGSSAARGLRQAKACRRFTDAGQDHHCGACVTSNTPATHITHLSGFLWGPSFPIILRATVVSRGAAVYGDGGWEDFAIDETPGEPNESEEA